MDVFLITLEIAISRTHMSLSLSFFPHALSSSLASLPRLPIIATPRMRRAPALGEAPSPVSCTTTKNINKDLLKTPLRRAKKITASVNVQH